jgi:hypothetical protein
MKGANYAGGPLPVAVVVVLVLLAATEVLPQGSEENGDFGPSPTIEILEPLEGAAVAAGGGRASAVAIRWRILEANNVKGKIAVAVQVDGRRESLVKVDEEECAAARGTSGTGGCEGRASVNLEDGEETGERLISLLLLREALPGHDSEDLGEMWDVAGEASAEVLVSRAAAQDARGGSGGGSVQGHNGKVTAVGASGIAGGGRKGRGGAASEDDDDDDDDELAVVFLSPRKGKRSFLDPSKVHIHVLIPGMLAGMSADVIVGSSVIAEGITVTEYKLLLPRMEPGWYPVQVILRNVDNRGEQVATRAPPAEEQFWVWPDHSWVGEIGANGQGTSQATAGQVAKFRILPWTRPQHCAATEGRDHFVVRLVGPAIVSGSVVPLDEGGYEVSYLAAEDGVYEMSVELHYDAGSGLQDYGEEHPRDIIGWHIKGSPFSVTVRGLQGGHLPQFHPYIPVAPCSSIGESEGGHAAPGRRSIFDGRWISKGYCEARALQCTGMAEDDDEWAWLPWICKHDGYDAGGVKKCWEERGRFKVLMAGTSQQRTLFFDIGKMLGTNQVHLHNQCSDVGLIVFFQ